MLQAHLPEPNLLPKESPSETTPEAEEMSHNVPVLSLPSSCCWQCYRNIPHCLCHNCELHSSPTHAILTPFLLALSFSWFELSYINLNFNFSRLWQTCNHKENYNHSIVQNRFPVPNYLCLHRVNISALPLPWTTVSQGSFIISLILPPPEWLIIIHHRAFQGDFGNFEFLSIV